MKYTKEELINYLRSFSLDNISQSYIDKLNGPSSSTYKRHFGSWRNAINCAGIDVGKISGRPQDKPIIISKRCIEIINGELLGDGCLYLSGQYKSNACFSHSTANFHYGRYLYNKLDIPVKCFILKERNGGKKQFRTRTTSNISWTEIYNKWYINGTKIVPEFNLTKETALHWYLGDGYFENKVKISTCGFSFEDNNKLCIMLKNLGFKVNVKKRSGDYYILVFDNLDFLDWIGDCPVIGYEHRWGKK